MTSEGYRDLLLHGGMFHLEGRTIAKFTGADRTRYLNGQVTANVQSLPAGRGLPACVTTAKGKLCAEGVVTNQGDALYFDADPQLRETLPPRFERYIIADDVVLEDVSDQIRIVHVLPGSIGSSVESLQEDFKDLDVAVVSRFGERGLDCFLPLARANDLPGKLMRLTEKDAETIRVGRGIPRWGYELDENTLPPEAGLDSTHIDYHKGCYIGQEVISRLKSIGHVNRRLTGFVSTDDVHLSRGALIYPASAPGRESCGVITSADWSFALEKPVALGYLRRSAPSGDLVARSEAPGAEPIPVSLSELPFTK